LHLHFEKAAGKAAFLFLPLYPARRFQTFLERFQIVQATRNRL
jgi:hypothetical protein